MTARRANKVDGNQTQIVEALRAAGCSVQSLADVGNGCPDILVGTRGQCIALELKQPGERLTPKQKKWHALWLGNAHIAYSAAEALAIVEHYRKRAAIVDRASA